MDGVDGHVDIEMLRARLVEHGQEHLLRFWDHLDETDRQHLTVELLSLDLEYVNRCYEACIGDLKRANGNCDSQLEPLPESVVGSIVRTDAETMKRYEQEGLKLFCLFSLVLEVEKLSAFNMGIVRMWL